MKSLPIILLIFLIVILGCVPPSKQALQPTPTPELSTSFTPVQETWDYDNSTDPMTSKPTKRATLISSNTLNFKFPYEGGSQGTLVVRRKNGKDDILLKISKGQFANTYEGSVGLRFDNQPSFTVSVGQTTDGSTDVIFLESPDKIVANLRKSSILRIEAQFYQEGVRVLEFNIKGLKW